ncbi:hypothetical protein FWF74_02055 [Candidatus Saccharibacteria bacterium]|nr:hypothetical protein [Candidatus Saccharibacteria bacterium]MCL1963255.1 hypothetical protein [Candidatus Saccharibacteria bacterium]
MIGFAETMKITILKFGEEWNMNAGLIAVIVAVGVVISLFMYGLNAFLLGRVFKKAGVPAWKAWVPYYNGWKMLQLGGYSGAWALMPFVTIAASVVLGLTAAEVLPFDRVVTLTATITIIMFSLIVFVAKYFLAIWNINKKLDKSGIYILLCFVNLGPSLWLWIMALDDSKWNDKLGRKSLAPEMRKKK